MFRAAGFGVSRPKPDEQRQQQSEISNPIKRIRWATTRATGQKAHSKRESILDRLHHRPSSAAKRRSKRSSASDTDPDMMKPGENESESSDGGRRIFFNIPLPPDARDEDCQPINHFARNKIRTAKYTPISFIPKNLWFQFHNIANMYFLFIIILSVSGASARLLTASDLCLGIFDLRSLRTRPCCSTSNRYSLYHGDQRRDRGLAENHARR